MDMVLENVDKKIKTEKFIKELPLRKALGTDGFLQTYKDRDRKCLQREEQM